MTDVPTEPLTSRWPSPWTAGSATYVPSAAVEPAGWPTADALEQSDVYMEAGPTGRSAYWPDWFGIVHPAYATTDVALNQVDEVWFDQPRRPVYFVVRVADTELPALSDVTQELRDMLDLPVGEVAALCGVSRRQFYNFLQGRRTSVAREGWILGLHAAVTRLYAAADGDKERLRAALLLPIAGEGSLLDKLRTRDASSLEPLVGELELQLSRGFEGRVRRPLPPRVGAERTDEVSDFLSDYSE